MFVKVPSVAKWLENESASPRAVRERHQPDCVLPSVAAIDQNQPIEPGPKISAYRTFG